MNKTIFMLTIMALIASCFCWGRLGHQAIADAAFSLVNENVKQAIKHYIAPFILPGIAPLPDLYAFTSVGQWSESLHFLNIARNATGYSDSFCPDPPSCVVKSILNYTKILLNEGRGGPYCISQYSPYAMEPCALIFLTHFVGDIHQPLHCGYKDDEGGNLVPIYYYSLFAELHQIWDINMIENYTASNLDYQKLSNGIQLTMKQYPQMVKYYHDNMNVILWANESIDYVRNTCYVFTEKDLQSKKNSFHLTPEDLKANPKLVSEVPHLGTWYFQRNLPVIFQRLTAASVRLAHLLNEIFGENKGRNLFNLLDPKGEIKMN